jgi:hypothetical protein
MCRWGPGSEHQVAGTSNPAHPNTYRMHPVQHYAPCVRLAIGCALILATGAHRLCAQSAKPSAVAASALLQHGEWQVSLMLAERSYLNQYVTTAGEVKYVTDKDAIYLWAVEHFVSQDGKLRFFWDPVEPDGDQRSSFRMPLHGAIGSIRLGDDRKFKVNGNLAFEKSWRAVISQLLSLRSYADHDLLHKEVMKNPPEVSEDEFVRRTVAIDFAVAKAEAVAFKELWEPWCKSVGIVPVEAGWTPGFSSADAMLAAYSKPAASAYLEYYRSFYKRLVGQGAAAKGGFPASNSPAAKP